MISSQIILKARNPTIPLDDEMERIKSPKPRRSQLGADAFCPDWRLEVSPKIAPVQPLGRPAAAFAFALSHRLIQIDRADLRNSVTRTQSAYNGRIGLSKSLQTTALDQVFTEDHDQKSSQSLRFSNCIWSKTWTPSADRLYHGHISRP